MVNLRTLQYFIHFCDLFLTLNLSIYLILKVLFIQDLWDLKKFFSINSEFIKISDFSPAVYNFISFHISLLILSVLGWSGGSGSNFGNHVKMLWSSCTHFNCLSLLLVAIWPFNCKFKVYFMFSGVSFLICSCRR